MALSYLFATFEVTVPLLVAGDPSDGGRAAAALREALALNSRLGADYFVADFDGCSPDFLLSPQNNFDARAGERALALTQSWVDTHLPEKLGKRPPGNPPMYPS